MTRMQIAALALVAVCCLAGCGPTVTVDNRTSFPVRVFIYSSGGSDTLSPSPGESSSAEVEEGKYSASVVPDTEWINYAKATRQYLNEQLANSDRLTGPQLLNVIQRLKDVAKQMAQYQNAGLGASCSGSVSQDSDGLVTISTGADGKLTAACK